MKYGWVKIQGYSYMSKIILFDKSAETCVIEIGEHVFTDVPFSEVYPVYNCKLPWQ